MDGRVLSMHIHIHCRTSSGCTDDLSHMKQHITAYSLSRQIQEKLTF